MSLFRTFSIRSNFFSLFELKLCWIRLENFTQNRWFFSQNRQNINILSLPYELSKCIDSNKFLHTKIHVIAVLTEYLRRWMRLTKLFIVHDHIRFRKIFTQVFVTSFNMRVTKSKCDDSSLYLVCIQWHSQCALKLGPSQSSGKLQVSS